MIQQGLVQSWQKRTWAFLLLPFSLCYFFIIQIRRQLYRLHILSTYRAPIPVIVIGNINVGGTGKTPLTLHLANTLQQQGFFPGIISRGYKATISRPQEVHTDSDPLLYGDEPTLMAQHTTAPVFVHRKRALAIQALLTAYPQCNIILCDDGLQHYALQRDIEIALLEIPHSLGNGWLLPAGPLREPVSRLKSVDFVVYHQKAPLTSLFLSSATPIHMQLLTQPFYQLTTPNHRQASTYFSDKTCHAVTGIGNPTRFFKTLSQQGIKCAFTAFADHHHFKAKDLPKAEIIFVTEKDAVKLKALKDDRIWVLPVQVKLEPNLTSLIINKLTNLSGNHG